MTLPDWIDKDAFEAGREAGRRAAMEHELPIDAARELVLMLDQAHEREVRSAA